MWCLSHHQSHMLTSAKTLKSNIMLSPVKWHPKKFEFLMGCAVTNGFRLGKETLSSTEILWQMAHTGVLISPQPDQEGNQLGSMSGMCMISTTSRRELSPSFPPPPSRQGTEGNSCHSDRNISFFRSWSGYGLISTPVQTEWHIMYR